MGGLANIEFDITISLDDRKVAVARAPDTSVHVDAVLGGSIRTIKPGQFGHPPHQSFE